jgi:hypothetical protein
MAGEKERVEGYLGTVNRLEPDIHMIDPGAFYASAAISLKRIADVLEKLPQAIEMAIQEAIANAEATQEGARRGFDPDTEPVPRGEQISETLPAPGQRR